jgi:hypothetical protein
MAILIQVDMLGLGTRQSSRDQALSLNTTDRREQCASGADAGAEIAEDCMTLL